MATANRRLQAATLQVLLLLVCVLTSASGLQSLPDDGPVVPPSGVVLVIDLGNTNSCITGYAAGGSMFHFCIPSWVAFTADGTALVGEAAKNHAGTDPGAATVAFGFKRLLGRLSGDNVYEKDLVVQRAIERAPYKMVLDDDVASSPSIQFSAKDGSVKQLGVTKVASMVIAELKAKAEEHLGHTVQYAFMTLPHGSSAAFKAAAEAAARMAGLVGVICTTSEPTAISVAHGLHVKLRGREGSALVLRVGGGTSDASIVTLVDAGIGAPQPQVIGYSDEPFLGGDDFDQRMVDYFSKQIEAEHGVDVGRDIVAMGKLRTACEQAKKALSSQEHVQVTVDSMLADGLGFSQSLSRSKFEELNEDLFHKRRKNKIDEIVLAGGSSMIPRVQSLVKDYFDGREPNVSLKPDEALWKHHNGVIFRRERPDMKKLL
ncbi:hypothetical protein U9M48_034907, partial [Paspalum notatum var. saurae]